MLPDVTTLLNDPDLGGGKAFEVKRTILECKAGKLIPYRVLTFSARGNVQPAGAHDLEKLPQEDRIKEVMVFRSTFAFQMGAETNEGSVQADEITFKGNLYRVLKIENWGEYGMYYAYASRVEGTHEPA